MNWKYKLKSGSALREAINNEDMEQVVKCLLLCYRELLDKLDEWDAEDYEIVPGSSNFQVLRKGTVIANFATEYAAQFFVERRTNPREVPLRFYSDMCRCGWAGEGWDYVSTEGLIFEVCNKCKQPLRMNIVDKFRSDSIADFDLDDFIDGV